jgi:hypothetical protein
VRIPALAGAGLILVVALGAANYGGVKAAPRHGGAQSGSNTCPITDQAGAAGQAG